MTGVGPSRCRCAASKARPTREKGASGGRFDGSQENPIVKLFRSTNAMEIPCHGLASQRGVTFFMFVRAS